MSVDEKNKIEYEKYRQDVLLFGQGFILISSNGNFTHVPIQEVIFEEDKPKWPLTRT